VWGKDKGGKGTEEIGGEGTRERGNARKGEEVKEEGKGRGVAVKFQLQIYHREFLLSPPSPSLAAAKLCLVPVQFSDTSLPRLFWNLAINTNCCCKTWQHNYVRFDNFDCYQRGMYLCCAGCSRSL